MLQLKIHSNVLTVPLAALPSSDPIVVSISTNPEFAEESLVTSCSQRNLITTSLALMNWLLTLLVIIGSKIACVRVVIKCGVL